jgi:hypothetical protein
VGAEEWTYERPAEGLAARDEPPVELEPDDELPDIHAEEHEREVVADLCSGPCQQERARADPLAMCRGHARASRAISAGDCQSTMLGSARTRTVVVRDRRPILRKNGSWTRAWRVRRASYTAAVGKAREEWKRRRRQMQRARVEARDMTDDERDSHLRSPHYAAGARKARVRGGARAAIAPRGWEARARIRLAPAPDPGTT